MRSTDLRDPEVKKVDNVSNGRPANSVRGAELQTETRTVQVGSVVLVLRRGRSGDRWVVAEP